MALPANFSQIEPIELVGITIGPVIWVALVIGVVSFASAALAILLLGNRLRRATMLSQPPRLADISDGAVIIFSRRKAWKTSQDASALLESLPEGKDSWTRIRDFFGPLNEGFADRLDALDENGAAFRETVTFADGTLLEIEGVPRGSLVALYFRDLSEDQKALIDTRAELTAISTEKSVIEAIIDAAPLLIWSRDRDGKLQWGNARARAVSHTEGTVKVLPQDLLGDPDSGTDNIDDYGNVTRRASIKDQSTGVDNWFEVREVTGGQDLWIGYGSNIDKLVRTEMTLQRFIATLTETFAHLSVGLAIFDAKRSLTLFNPALTDLMELDPAWLARRPSFREFFETLREGHLMPAQKNADEWRSLIGKIEGETMQGILNQKWVLPNGRTFQVTGKPHPHGAIAMLFEDVSATAMLEQRYRTEIELSQATLDRLSEAVAVFDTSGALVFANSAFTQIWGFDPMETLEPMNIVETTERWADLSLPTPAWGDLRDFTTRTEDRVHWDARIELDDGRHLHAGFSPLPDGSSLAVFSDVTDETRIAADYRARIEDVEGRVGGRAATLTLAIEQLRDTVSEVAEALGTAAADTGKDQLRAWHATLTNALGQSHDIMTLNARPFLPSGITTSHLVQDLAELAATRGFQLDSMMDEEIARLEPGEDLRRLLLNIVLVCSEVLRPEEPVQLALVALDTGVSVSCTGAVISADVTTQTVRASLPFRLLERQAEKLDGTVTLTEIDSAPHLKIACTVPALSLQSSPPQEEDAASA